MKVRCFNNIVSERKLLSKFVLKPETLSGLNISKVYDAYIHTEESTVWIVNEYHIQYKFSTKIDSPWYWEKFFERLRDKNLEDLGL